MNTARIFNINHKNANNNGPVVYWMSRDQRIHDNWALFLAQKEAIQRRKPLHVVFNLVPQFLGATWRQYAFMLSGLKELEKALTKKNIPLSLLLGMPEETIPRYAKAQEAALIVCDFSPLRIARQWQKKVNENLNCSFVEVDAHNIVPVRIASTKKEFGAYTLRPKLKRQIDHFLTLPPPIVRHPFVSPKPATPVDWDRAQKSLQLDFSVGPVTSWIPGEKAATTHWKKWRNQKLAQYDSTRNDPTVNGQSDLSPYLHFGQIAAARIVQEALPLGEKISAAFLEELVIRRELSDNFCFYEPHYDQFTGFPDWAQMTLNHHRRDPRTYVYSRAIFESAQTHDPLWNAAQKQMLQTGKMHGFMRMYWAKKILEWTSSPEEALETAIALNDRWELDGRDPNGYAGIAWAIGGVHDRAWGERPIFGKIRYMNDRGCARKFDVSAYQKSLSRNTSCV